VLLLKGAGSDGREEDASVAMNVMVQFTDALLMLLYLYYPCIRTSSSEVLTESLLCT
jgi:hypothetical protein